MVSEIKLMRWEDYLPTFPDKFFDIAVCDIPYGIGVGKMAYLSEKKTTIKQKNGNRLQARKRDAGYSEKEWDNTPPAKTILTN